MKYGTMETQGLLHILGKFAYKVHISIIDSPKKKV